MLHARTVLSRDVVTVADVACRHELGHGQPAEYTGGHTLVMLADGAREALAAATHFVPSWPGVRAQRLPPPPQPRFPRATSAARSVARSDRPRSPCAASSP